MKSFFIAVAFLIFFSKLGIAQKYVTKNGHISFFSKADIENIQADNNQVMSVLDSQSGQLYFSLLIKSFHFKKALMEEHFNDNYLESNLFPKAAFKGIISEINSIDFSKEGSYPVTVNGDLSIHEVTNKITCKGSIIIKAGKINCTSVLIIRLADYKITIPKLVENNISKTIEIKVNCLYDSQL